MSQEPEDYRLPRESKSQRYGKEAVQAFENARPPSWSIHDLEGDDDFGLDKQVQVPDQNDNGRIVGLFYVQIKGSAENALSSDGEYFSVSLKVTTLNYYARIQDPVMLAFADLSAGQDPRDSPVYWTWISEDIRKLLGGRTDFSDLQQVSITVHIPSKNKLARDLDIVKELAAFRRRANALKGLCHSVSIASDGGIPLDEAIGTISRAMQRHGRPLMGAFLEHKGSRWVEPPTGSIPAHLRDAQTRILENDDVAAEEILARIAKRIAADGTATEQADFEFLLGKVCWIRGDLDRAIEHYDCAQRGDAEIPKYHVAYIEARFSAAYPQDMDAVREVFHSIRDDDDEDILCIKARILGALGDTIGAFELIEQSTSIAGQVARALLAYLDKNWDDTILLCEQGLARDDLRKNDKVLFHILIARALFYQCLSDHQMDPSYEFSAFGTSDMDFSTAQAAWRAAKEALTHLRESGWPSNSEHIIDVLNALATSLNREKEVLVDIASLSRRRPHLLVVHEALHRLAAISSNNELALEALTRLPDNDDILHKRILLLHALHRHKEALELAEARLLTADSNNKFHGPCLGTAALSAHSLLEPDRAVPFEKTLTDSPALIGDAAVYAYVFSCNESPLTLENSLQRFCEEFHKYPDAVPIQDNLFMALDANDHEQADLCVEVSARIIARRRLAAYEVSHLAQAYATLSSWDALLALAEDAISQYGPTPLFESIRALAFDGKGNTAQALKILESILSNNPEEELAIDWYVSISARNGFHREALDHLQTLYQKSSTVQKRATYLRQMFGLEMALNPSGTRMFDIAWRYGQLCDRTQEEDEGIFLQMFLMSTLHEKIKVTSEQKAEFHERTAAYFEKFPDSAFIKQVEFPRDADADTFKRLLYETLGVTPQLQRWFQRVENQLQRGELAAPFAWRPKRLLRNVPDIAYLWHIAKQSSRDAHAYHLNIYGNKDEKKANITRGPNRIPLCDLTTLIVLTELELLDQAFDVLGTIAIGKRTIAEIQHLAHPYLGGYTLFQQLSDKLRQRIHNIEQPEGLRHPDSAESKLDESLEEVISLARRGRYTLFIDDALARQYVGMSVENVDSLTTIDLLAELNRRGLMSTSQVSATLAQLIDWRVGVWVEGRYFLGAIPTAVSEITDLGQLTDLLGSDKTYSRMIDGLWDFRHDYKKVLNHWGYQLAHVAASKEAPTELIAALWCTWLGKVKFRTDPSLEPLEHLACSLIRAAVLAKDDSAAVARLWNAFVRVVETIHGSRMDEDKERYARLFVGRIAARIVHNKEDVEVRDRIYEAVCSGLEPGTAEYDHFNRGYESERIRLEEQSTGSNE